MMLFDLRIENFRCFHETEIAGFKNINLISGKNNSGKTALLEAIYLLKSPTPEALLNLRKIRKESELILKEMPANAWDELFSNRKKDKTIEIIQLSPFLQEDFRSSLSLPHLLHGDIIVDFRTVQIEFWEADKALAIKYGANSFKTEEALSANKAISWEHITEKYNPYFERKKGDLLYLYEGNIFLEDPENVTKKGKPSMIAKKEPNELYEIECVQFLPSRAIIAEDKQLAILYSQVRKKNANTIKTLLEGFQAIDENIEFVELIVDAEPTLYLQKKGEDTRPLKMFGDAMNRIAEFILKIIANEGGTLLIDEIENGIHWSNQEKVWEIIFTLAEKHEVQIFATTHSKEMIETFARVAQKMNKQNLAAYVEMYRNVRTGEIAAHIHDTDLLVYELKNDIEIRGKH